MLLKINIVIKLTFDRKTLKNPRRNNSRIFSCVHNMAHITFFSKFSIKR